MQDWQNLVSSSTLKTSFDRQDQDDNNISHPDASNPRNRTFQVDSSPLAETSFATTARLQKLRMHLSGGLHVNSRYGAETGTGLTQSLPTPEGGLLSSLPIFTGNKVAIQRRFMTAMSAPIVAENPFDTTWQRRQNGLRRRPFDLGTRSL